MLSEGVNMQDGQVVINYELHWNPVRIIQRIGRIDRIGSEHNEIYVYNFFPQAAVEEEINVEKKVNRRIDEIIRIYGADTKTISQNEEEVLKKLFQIYTEDERALEETEEESTSAYFKHQWKRLRDEYGAEYQKALELPAMVNSGLASMESGLGVFCRADDYYKLVLANKYGAIISRNDWKVLKLLECDLDAPAKALLDEHLAVLEKVRKEFEVDANRREGMKRTYLGKIKDQIIKKLDWAKRGKTERFKSEVGEAVDMVRESKLTLHEKRELRGVRSKYGLTPQELIQQVREVVETAQKRVPPKIEKKYAQVIISESLRT